MNNDHVQSSTLPTELAALHLPNTKIMRNNNGSSVVSIWFVFAATTTAGRLLACSQKQRLNNVDTSLCLAQLIDAIALQEPAIVNIVGSRFNILMYAGIASLAAGNQCLNISRPVRVRS